MKKLLLATILTVGYSYTQDIPTLESFRPGFNRMKAGLQKSFPDDANKLDEVSFLGYSINRQLHSSDIPPETIEATLKQWYKENPTVFHQTTTAINGLPAATIADGFASKVRLYHYLPQNELPSETHFIVKLWDTILDVLKQLGVKPILSEEQIDNIAKSEAERAVKQEHHRQELMKSSDDFDENNIE